MGEACLNCGEEADGTHEILVRSNNHRDVPLCTACHEAITETIDA